MYDAYRTPAAPPPPPPPPKKSFWTRPKVGMACLVLGLLIGVAGAGDTEPTSAEPAEPKAVAAPVIEQGPSEEEVHQQVDDAVAAATSDLEGTLTTQQEQATADLEQARQDAKASQTVAVKKAVRRALANAPRTIVRVPVAAPAAPAAPVPAPQPSTDPRFGTCGEANDAGYGPYRSGVDPEYDWYEDRDGDGIDCES